MANIAVRVTSVQISGETGLMTVFYMAGVPDGRIFGASIEGVGFASSAAQIKGTIEDHAKERVLQLYGLTFGGGDTIVLFGGVV